MIYFDYCPKKIMFDIRRARKLNDKKDQEGGVLYWMSRDIRIEDNWALLLAAQLASQKKSKLTVVFTLVPGFLDATWRHYEFMLKGLLEVESGLKLIEIDFVLLLCDEPSKAILELVSKNSLGVLITDFSPLRISRGWKEKIASEIIIPMIEVDSHNVVPVWVASPKQEFAARTIRPKITKLLPEFLIEIPKLTEVFKSSDSDIHFITDNLIESKQVSIQEILDIPKDFLKINFEVLPYSKANPGSNAGKEVFESFCLKLQNYNLKRNDPNANALSDLSPYYHYGFISTQRVALDLIARFGEDDENVKAYIEEMIVRRELSDNYCFYQENYDNYEGLANWAKLTLTKHWTDERDFLYTLEDWENNSTHDQLWNAANNEMKKTGIMHGFMRMYWAKKILEWSANPSEAIKIAIYLNDKYSIDGRDPNGYVGILWSIGGLHDRAWFERPVYGQIRYMNYNGCKNKFDVKEYERRWSINQSLV
jgi:deoxyribodipyrimidine photo-lyase